MEYTYRRKENFKYLVEKRFQTKVNNNSSKNIDFDLLDSEDTGSGSSRTGPWDPSQIRITTKAFSLRDVVDQISDQEIDLAPDFQREYVWKDRQRTRLVESILLGIPLPAFYFNQAIDGTYQVVDGVQRLSTICLFMQDKHRIIGADLEYLTNIDGLLYSQLDAVLQRRLRGTQIVVHIIEPQTPDEVKFDIFNRVNTLGSPLSAQEIRHAMSKARSRNFLKTLTELPAFDLATENQYLVKNKDGTNIRNSGRMANRELALRFCAFRCCSIDEYRQYPTLDAFLIDFTRRIDGKNSSKSITDDCLRELSTAFERGMINAHQILEEAAFRRWPLGSRSRRGAINRALFEAQANALADYPLKSLLPHKQKIVTSFRQAFSDPEYLKSVTVSTGSPTRINYRLTETREILARSIR